MKTNKAGLAKILGVSLTTIDSWVRKGCPGAKDETTNRWTFDTRAVFKWTRDEGAGLDLTRERAGLTRAQRIKAEHEVRQIEEQEMIPKSNIVKSFQHLLDPVLTHYIRNHFSNRKLPPLLAEAHTIRECEDLLKQARNEMWSAMAKNFWGKLADPDGFRTLLDGVSEDDNLNDENKQ